MTECPEAEFPENACPVTVERITIYPVKSLPGVEVAEAELLPAGPLRNDRRWVLCDAEGGVINAKRKPEVLRIAAAFSADLSQLELSFRDAAGIAAESHQWDWLAEQSRIEEWLSECLQQAVRIVEEEEQGFPDDTLSPGPTWIGSATLERLHEWFPELSIVELRRRFRANIELRTSVPFWEDVLFGPPGQPRRFAAGTAEFWGVNPCQRCAVPARDSQTGAMTAEFQKRFARLRQESLPAGIAREHFNHFYRLAVNSRRVHSSTGERIQHGDLVRVLSEQDSRFVL